MKLFTRHTRFGTRTVTGCTALVAAMALGAGTRQAHACGGLFCDGPPPNPFSPLPVAQNGENVVFAIDKDPAGGAPTQTVHIQILYTGDAAQFSWILPLDAMPGPPEVGTDALFASLLSATQPRFQTVSVTDGQCLPDSPCTTCDKGGMTSGPRAAVDASFNGAGGTPSVNVSFQGAVGPYAAAV